MGHRHFNGLKTVALFSFLWVVLLAIWAVFFRDSAGMLWLFAGLGLVSTAYGYWNSDKIAIRSMRAQPVTEAEQPVMYRVVRELSQKANQPMPRLFVSPTPAPNAFATGRNPKNAAVCCTAGILQILDERELRGVLGHELMHVYNRDILTSSVAAAIAGIITSIASMMFWFGAGDRRGNNGGNAAAGFALMLLAPLAGTVIQLAISRTREYDADEDGATLTGDPMALASALRKLESGTKAAPLPADQKLVDVSHLMIANPFKAGGVSKLFSTHPPMDKRIQRLEAMAGTQGGITYY
jgi:heat shock protein HtpX